MYVYIYIYILLSISIYIRTHMHVHSKPKEFHKMAKCTVTEGVGVGERVDVDRGSLIENAVNSKS